MTNMDLPFSEEAEQGVLGAVLMNAEALIVVAESLKAHHFYLARHQQIYEAMLACHRAAVPADMRTVSEELRRRGQLTGVGGIAYLGQIIDQTPNSGRISYYARDLLAMATRRALIQIGGRIAAMGYDETAPLSSLLTQAHALLDGAGTPLADPRYRPIAGDELDALDIPPLKWVVPGLIPEGMTLLIGKPKMRKSWLAQGVGIAVASGGHVLGSIPVEQGDVLYLALEDGTRRLKSRQRKLLGSGPASKRIAYLTAAPRIDDGCIELIDEWARTRADARLVVVDVFAKVRPAAGGRNMYDEDYAAVGPLQQLAARRGLAVVVVHHMNRSDADDVFDLINGSNGIGGAADGVLALVYERGQQDATLKISGRDIEDDAALKLRWDHTTAQWILLGKAEEVEANEARREILELLRSEKRPLTPRLTAELLGKMEMKEYAAIKQLMYRMGKDGVLVPSGSGTYTLPALTLLGSDNPDDDDDAAAGYAVTRGGDPVIDGDRGRSPGVLPFRTPETASGDRGDRMQRSVQNHDHRDHPITGELFEASGRDRPGDPAPITGDHRPPDLPPDAWEQAKRLWNEGSTIALKTLARRHWQTYDDLVALIKQSLASSGGVA